MEPADENRAQQEANNTRETLKEFMMKTLKQFCSIATSPVSLSNQEILEMFRNLPSTEKRNELSIYGAIVPVASDVLVSMMLDAHNWASSLSHIVRLVSSNILPGTFQQLSSDDRTIRKILMLSADLQFPTPSTQQQRRVNFFRSLKEINEETWLIFDISTEYLLPNPPERYDSWKRLSGVIIKRSNNFSKVIWVEHMNGPDYYGPDSHVLLDIYADLKTSGMGFSARRWVTTLIWWYKRTLSTLTKDLMDVKVEKPLLKLTEKMKMDFLEIVKATPDDRKWAILCNEKVRVMKSRTDTFNDQFPKRYVGVTTFRLGAAPSEVFSSLTRQNVEIQWPKTPENSTGHEELVKCVAEEDYNCITLHRREMYDVQNRKNPVVNEVEYLLQETSRDGFCSFIVAAPMTQIDVQSSLLSGTERDMMLCPGGFAILPHGVDPSVSLITVAAHHLVTTDITRDIVSAMYLCFANIKKKIGSDTGFHITD